MTTVASPVKTEKSKLSPAENLKGIENHKKAATHFEAAAKHHTEAAKHQENGHHDKAALSTVAANGHQTLGRDAQKEVAKHHAILN